MIRPSDEEREAVVAARGEGHGVGDAGDVDGHVALGGAAVAELTVGVQRPSAFTLPLPTMA